MLCDICSNSGVPIPGGREFVRQCVYYLITCNLLIPATLIFVVLGISFLIRLFIKIKEDEEDE